MRSSTVMNLKLNQWISQFRTFCDNSNSFTQRGHTTWTRLLNVEAQFRWRDGLPMMFLLSSLSTPRLAGGPMPLLSFLKSAPSGVALALFLACGPISISQARAWIPSPRHVSGFLGPSNLHFPSQSTSECSTPISLMRLNLFWSTPPHGPLYP